MTGQPKMPSIEELVKSALHKSGGVRCWALGLSPAAAEYMKALHSVEAQRPGSVNRSQVRRDLMQYFDTDINLSTVKRHFSRECQCVWP